MAESIRPIVVCVPRNRRSPELVLVEAGYDRAKGQRFFRPLGGGLEFGERAQDAIAREMREELDAVLTHVRLLGVLENIFTFEGTAGHEIVFVFSAEFADPSLDELLVIEHQERSDKRIVATWVPLTAFERPGAPPLYPDGLLDLLKGVP